MSKIKYVVYGQNIGEEKELIGKRDSYFGAEMLCESLNGYGRNLYGDGHRNKNRDEHYAWIEEIEEEDEN